MEIWENFKRNVIERNGEESDVGTSQRVPEMSEVPFCRGSSVLGSTGNMDVAKVWGEMLSAGKPSSSHSSSSKITQTTKTKKPAVEHEELEHEDVEAQWSNNGEGGSDEPKSITPMLNIINEMHWKRLEDTDGVMNVKERETNRMWNAISWLDRRSIALRSYALDANDRIRNTSDTQDVMWENIDSFEASIREKVNRLQAEQEAFKNESELLREEITQLKEENQTLLSDNAVLVRELRTLKDEHQKVQSVVIEMISYLQNREQPKFVKENQVEDPSINKSEYDASRKENGSNHGEGVPESNANNENMDLMSFLYTPLMNPVTRREKINCGKLPKPTPNREALNALPKYMGTSGNMGTKDLQRVTLEWLSTAEGVVLSQEATIQDVYDRLPSLLEGTARIWLQQTVKTQGHFETWNHFRQELLNVFLGPDWKYSLERSFATIKQGEKEPGVNYVLRVWNTAKQIDPEYAEGAILAKIATTMNPRLWNRIPREERKDYFSLVKVVAVYDEESRTSTQGHLIRESKPNKPTNPKQTSTPNAKPKKRICYLCGGEGHIAKDCPKRNIVAATFQSNADQDASGKVKGALLGTK
jgi:hypothetical protein